MNTATREPIASKTPTVTVQLEYRARMHLEMSIGAKLGPNWQYADRLGSVFTTGPGKHPHHKPALVMNWCLIPGTHSDSAHLNGVLAEISIEGDEEAKDFIERKLDGYAEFVHMEFTKLGVTVEETEIRRIEVKTFEQEEGAELHMSTRYRYFIQFRLMN